MSRGKPSASRPAASGVPVGTVDEWRLLDGEAGQALLGEVAGQPEPSVIARLRKRHPAGLVAAAVEASLARTTLVRKFGKSLGTRLIADRAGAEMASTIAAAEHKARRLREIGDAGRGPVIDLCSGIGIDAAVLAARLGSCEAVDADPVRCWMTMRNAALIGENLGAAAGVTGRCADATESPLPADAAVHLDPARRSRGGGRARGIEEIEPGPGFLARLVASVAAGVVKLAPGIDPDDIAPSGEPLGRLEYVSERGKLSQALLHFGPGVDRAAPPLATMLAETGEALTITADGSARAAFADVPSGLVFTVNPAVERADALPALAVEMGLAVLRHRHAGLLTGDAGRSSPWLTAFEVLAHLPWNARRVRERLQALRAGIVEVKTRGRVVDPDALQRELRGSGQETLTVFIQRLGDPLETLICRRVRQ